MTSNDTFEPPKSALRAFAERVRGMAERGGDQPVGKRLQRPGGEGQGGPARKTLPRSRSTLLLGAIALIALAVLASPRDESVEAKLEQGVAAHNSGRTAQATELYREVLRRDPGNAVANFNLGVVAQREKRLAEAENYYQEALEKEPDFIAARFNYAILKETQGDYAAAERLYREILEKHPGEIKPRVNLGFLLVDDLNRRDEGIEEFRKAVEVDPNVITRIPADLRPVTAPAPAAPKP